VDELLDELCGAQYFSKSDLVTTKFWSRQKIGTKLPSELTRVSEWLVMPFGLSNAPASFQSLMNHIFQAQLRKSILVFFKDILVYSPTWSTHLTYLSEVLTLMHHHSLFAKLSKCCFGFTTVDYLGHTISSQGVHMDRSKVKAVLDWLVPQTLKQLRGFLGLSGYYRRFIRNYAFIAAPLTTLLKKDAFGWTPTAATAFDSLKHAIIVAPVLAIPDFSKPWLKQICLCQGAICSYQRHG
jgi:hypothetical protein